VKILYYGVFDGKKWRSEYPMSDGLTALGHDLIKCNFRSRWPGQVLKAWHNNKNDIDLIFLQNGIPFKASWLNKMKEKPLVFLASEYALSSAEHILKSSRLPDLVLAHSEQTHIYCQQEEIPVQRVHHAYNHSQYRSLALPFEYDVCFVGGMTPKRARFLSYLKKSNYKVCITKNWNAHAINRIYNQSKIVLHIHGKDVPYLPTRLFEVLPTQGCLLIEDLHDNEDTDLGTDFYKTFASPEQMLSQIHVLLQDEILRSRLVQRANTLAEAHSWQARMKRYETYFESVLP